jgi:hypothetical protein
MKDMVDLQGASGTTYRFQLFRDGRPLSPMGGNYIYVREELGGGRFEVLLSGEGENLLVGAKQQWDHAVAEHGATHLYTRLNISQSIRKHEHADLTEHYQPAMNATWTQIKGAPPSTKSSAQPEA